MSNHRHFTVSNNNNSIPRNERTGLRGMLQRAEYMELEDLLSEYNRLPAISKSSLVNDLAHNLFPDTCTESNQGKLVRFLQSIDVQTDNIVCESMTISCSGTLPVYLALADMVSKCINHESLKITLHYSQSFVSPEFCEMTIETLCRLRAKGLRIEVKTAIPSLLLTMMIDTVNQTRS